MNRVRWRRGGAGLHEVAGPIDRTDWCLPTGELAQEWSDTLYLRLSVDRSVYIASHQECEALKETVMSTYRRVPSAGRILDMVLM